MLSRLVRLVWAQFSTALASHRLLCHIRRLGCKGFLGPIGDDLPSLIPLLFALLIFFSTFSFSFNTFSNENNSFDADLAVLNISRIIKGTNYITGYSDFLKKCNSINISNVKYRAIITNYFTAPEVYANSYPVVSSDFPRSYELGPYQNSNGDFFECKPSASTSNYPDFSNQSELREYFGGRTVLTRVYPLVVEDERVVRPMHLVVIAWRS